MTAHDPLCPTVYLPGEGGCRCALIARVVEREREERERDWAEAYVRVDAEARADERNRLHRDGWATPEQLEAMIAAAKARVLIHERKRIAQEIEARAGQYGNPPPGPEQVLVAAYRDAARIARGEQP